MCAWLSVIRSARPLNSPPLYSSAAADVYKGQLLDPLPEPVDVLIANLPYVGHNEMALLAADVRAFEPHLALFSGTDGLDLLRRLFVDARRLSLLKPAAMVCLEIGYQQREPSQLPASPCGLPRAPAARGSAGPLARTC